METTVETSSYILAWIDIGFLLRYFINLVLLIVKLVPAKDTQQLQLHVERKYYHKAMAKKIFHIIHHEIFLLSATCHFIMGSILRRTYMYCWILPLAYPNLLGTYMHC